MCVTDFSLCVAPGQRPTTDLLVCCRTPGGRESNAVGSRCRQVQGGGGVMGKGSRVRASRQVDRRGRPTPSPGVAFGIGVAPLASTGLEAPEVARDDVVGGVQEYDVAWRAAARVMDALAHLRELAVARAEARRVVEGLEEEVEVAVAHLRVVGASWAQVGRALGISRQGARQRFGDASGTHGIRQAPRDP